MTVESAVSAEGTATLGLVPKARLPWVSAEGTATLGLAERLPWVSAEGTATLQG